jgi:hypothetical protein
VDPLRSLTFSNIIFWVGKFLTKHAFLVARIDKIESRDVRYLARVATESVNEMAFLSIKKFRAATAAAHWIRIKS